MLRLAIVTTASDRPLEISNIPTIKTETPNASGKQDQKDHSERGQTNERFEDPVVHPLHTVGLSGRAERICGVAGSTRMTMEQLTNRKRDSTFLIATFLIGRMELHFVRHSFPIVGMTCAFLRPQGNYYSAPILRMPPAARDSSENK